MTSLSPPGAPSGPGARARRLLPRVGVAAGAVGALGLVEHRRLGPLTRAAYRIGEAVLAGAVTADTARLGGDALLDPLRDGVVTAGVSLGLSELTENLDARLVDGLRARGLFHPRVAVAALGVVSVVGLYAITLVGNRSEQPTSIEEWIGEPEATAVPPAVRALTALLLDGPQDGPELPGADALRAQLAVSQAARNPFADHEMQFLVESPAALAVPHQQTWPVTGEFSRGGFRFTLELTIAQGRLAGLSVLVADDEPRAEEALGLLDEARFPWPVPAAVTVRRQSERP